MPKKFLDRLTALLFACAILGLFALGITAVLPEAQAQIRNMNPTPSLFADYTGTNWMGFNANAGLEIRSGGSIYTGATTNVYLTNVFALRIVNGSVVGIIVP